MLPVDALLLGSMMTTLEPDEMIVAARLPLLADGVRVVFHEFARRAGDFAQVMAVAVLGLGGPRIAVGAIEARPRRLPDADDAYLAEDAAELVLAEIEERPAVLDATAEPTEFLPGHSTEPTVVCKAYGDVDGAFQAAHAMVELALSVGRHSGVPLECRGAIARYDAARDVLELHGTAKKQHWNRDEIARLLGRAPSGVHLFEGHVGGGFGVRRRNLVGPSEMPHARPLDTLG